MKMNTILAAGVAVVMGAFAGSAMAQDAITTASEARSLDDLLNMVQSGKISETAQHRAREAEFNRDRGNQQSILNQRNQDRASEERRAQQLEDQIRSNEVNLTQLTEKLNQEKGNLNEAFGTIQQYAGDMRSVIQASHVSLEHGDRVAGINTLIEKTSEGTELPSVAEIEELWKQMVLEMTESGKVSTFTMDVQESSGDKVTKQVTRVGDFNVVADGKYYRLSIGTDGAIVEELGSQPPSRFTNTISDIENATGGVTTFAIDPSRGTVLALLIQAPDIVDRWHQGGVVGYIITAIGILGALVSIIRFIDLFTIRGRVRAQIRTETPNTKNPLGRVLTVYEDNKSVDVETLELKLDEAILKETPRLEMGLNFIKLISAVAPLLGLLGTVTGMIATFQSITLFGTGDPKLMAGGISTALVTTVLGLVVAIPTLMLHSFVSGISRGIVHVLEEQSAGIIAVHAEKQA